MGRAVDTVVGTEGNRLRQCKDPSSRKAERGIEDTVGIVGTEDIADSNFLDTNKCMDTKGTEDIAAGKDNNFPPSCYMGGKLRCETSDSSLRDGEGCG